MRTLRFGGHEPIGLGIDITPVVRNLLIANVAVWLAQIGFGFAHVDWFDELFALDPSAALPGRPWQFVTYMFMHSAPSHGSSFSVMHILGNMLTLCIFGGQVERAMGGRGFLRYYLLCGLGGGLVTLLPPFREATTIGASGAILGVLTAYGILFADQPIFLLFFTLRAKILVLLVALFNLFSAMGPQAGVSFIAHLGGMAAGFLLLRGGAWTRRWTRRWDAHTSAREQERRTHLLQRRDEILDKMSREGRESLTRDEWRTLLEESKRLRKDV